MARSLQGMVGGRRHVFRVPSVVQYLKDSRTGAMENPGPVYTIDGNACRTAPGFHDSIATEMNFPAYYGENLAALADCFFDLQLRTPGSAILAIRNADELYADEPPDYLDGLLDTLEDIGQTWLEGLAEPVELPPQHFMCLFVER